MASLGPSPLHCHDKGSAALEDHDHNTPCYREPMLAYLIKLEKGFSVRAIHLIGNKASGIHKENALDGVLVFDQTLGTTETKSEQALVRKAMNIPEIFPPWT